MPRIVDDQPDDAHDEEGELLAKFQKWDKAIDAKRGSWLEETKESYDFLAGRQWADEDMPEEGRVQAVFNRVAPTIDAVSGAEIQGRQRIQYNPRQVGSSAVDEILTQGAAYIRDQCNAGDEESEAFRDLIICGEGWTETRPDVVYDPPSQLPPGPIDPNWLDTQIIISRVDPQELGPDPSSRQANYADARYIRRSKVMSRDEFEEMWPGEEPAEGDEAQPKRATIVEPRLRYTHGMGAENDNDEVTVREYQWFDNEPIHIVRVGRDLQQLTADQHDALKDAHPDTQSVKIMRRKYRRAFVCGEEVLKVEEIEAGAFTYLAMTGKRDRNKGTWFGLLRAMKDPARFNNKLFSQIINIINTNAKGGLMAEEGAFKDQKQAEASWADASTITFLETGSLSNPNGPRIQLKPSPPYPQGSDRLMQVSQEGIRDVTGVNQEMLGLADRDQPGVLEYQRKQAAHGILAVFFDAKRRYHKQSGQLLLIMMRLYMKPGTLVKIVGQDGEPQYVPMALQPETAKYDVIVDEVPDGPNQKMQVFQMLLQLAPLLSQADLGDEVWAQLVKYMPVGAAVIEALQKAFMDKAKAQQAAAPQQQAMQQAAFSADIGEKQAGATLKNAQAQAALANAGADPGKAAVDDARARLDHARVAEIETNIVRTILEPHNQPQEASPNV